MAPGLIDAPALSRRFTEAFSLPIRISAVSEPISEELLLPREREQLARLNSPLRRAGWLRGRAALRRLGFEDSSALSFPRADCSLAHSGDWAVAASLPPGAAAGLGVDLEAGRAPREEAARKFLDERERAWLAALEARARGAALIRFWTVKEAAFKADPENRGCVVGDYLLEDPGAERGGVRRRDRRFEYDSCLVDEGRISIAVLRSVAPETRAQ